MNKIFSVFYNNKKEEARVMMNSFSLSLKKRGGSLIEEKIKPETQIVAAIGGDGTLLRAARVAAYSGKAVAYLNVGTLGFLGSRIDNVDLFVDKLVSGKFNIEKRIILEAAAGLKKFRALNDIVVKNGATARVIELEVYVDGISLGNLKGDGVIVSTPTGSTAYSLAAGGPVVSPRSDVIVITPLNPHSLNSRSVVISSASLIKICSRIKQPEIIMTADGQQSICMDMPIDVEVSKYSKSLDLVCGEDGFLKTLSDSMNWGGRHGRGIKNDS